MSRREVVAIATGDVDYTVPSGHTRMGIYRGHRYLATEEVVRQHPELFVPWPIQPTPPAEKPA